MLLWVINNNNQMSNLLKKQIKFYLKVKLKFMKEKLAKAKLIF